MNRPPLNTPEQAEAAFYAAFEACDLEAMMAVWSNDARVVCIHPGGERHVGREAVADSWRRIFAGSGRLRFRIGARASVSGDTLVVSSVIEHIGLAGSPGTTPVIATNVFVRGAAGWELWMHHATHHPEPEAAAGDDDGDEEQPDGAEDDAPPPTLH